MVRKKKSGFLRSLGIQWNVWSALINDVLERGGDNENIRRIETDHVMRGDLVDRILRDKLFGTMEVEYFTPLTDADAPEQYQSVLAKYRKLATEHGVPATTAVCYRVRAGFTLKSHAPKAGPCYEQYAYLQGWNFPDEATSDGVVFWVPRIIINSTSKTKQQQIELLCNLRSSLELPAHHMSGFGKVGLLAGLILAHYKATGERIPLDQFWVRTDTCFADGDRLRLGSFGDAGLSCDHWFFDAYAYGSLGVFALGVEALGS